MVGKYKVVTLCGSTRFKNAFLEVQKQLTFNGCIVISVGLFGHSGDEWMLPDKQSVIDMTTAFSSAPDAYTLDVGVLSTGGTAVVEVHNFVSCGLYGFGANNAEDLIHMVIAGYLTWTESA